MSLRRLSTALETRTTATPKVEGSKLDPSESFLSGTNAVVLEDMYEKWLADPSSVLLSLSRQSNPVLIALFQGGFELGAILCQCG